MKKITLLIIFLSSFFFIFGQENNINTEKKVFGLSKIYKEVDYNFPYLTDSKVNWDSLYVSYIKKVELSKSDKEYYHLLNEFLSHLKEGHTYVVSPFQDTNIGVVTIALSYINSDSSFYVIGLGNDFSDIKIGYKLISINGLNVHKYADSVFYNNTNYKKRVFYNYIAPKILSGPLGDSLKLTFINPANNQIFNKNAVRQNKYGNWVSYKSIYDSRKIFDFNTYDSTAYIKIGSFNTFEPIKNFYAYADSINNCKNVIIDIRGNYGGTSYGDYIVNFFTKDSILYSYRKYRINYAYYKALGQFTDSTVQKIIKSKKNLDSYSKFLNYYNGTSFKVDTILTKNNTQSRGVFKDKKLILLVDRFTASAAETFAITLINNCDILIMGQPSFGSTGQPLIVPLPGGGHARIISSIPLYNDGSQFNYIIPNIIIEPTIQDYIEKNDSVLLEAVRILK